MAGAALAASCAYALTVAVLLQRFRRHAGFTWAEILLPRGDQLRRDGAVLLQALRPARPAAPNGGADA
jgi:mRNA-degrading endonuclease toxin of MazEF toxin-antitoxin module